MRAVELREPLAGKPGRQAGLARRSAERHDFPLVARRRSTAGLIDRSVCADPIAAERIVRLLFPFVLLNTLLVLAAWNAWLLSRADDRRAGPIGVWLTLLTGLGLRNSHPAASTIMRRKLCCSCWLAAPFCTVSNDRRRWP